ncbi:alpha/beta fold hydrolase [Robertmurraya massiliosenegalensis]|uniref:alpha/beta fold hydrolase n=1 Tax=Robertmurraya massiliosenegalensis TaxID=1287657 RepID=UPI000312204E|nr:alpha/beta fold hydrolase [Robertmurraya massiliosenegalensis]
MKSTVIFIHSAGPQGPNQGSSNLITYLNKELMPDYSFRYPDMPTPENPNYVEWKVRLEQELKSLSGDVILIGHSLGGSVLLKYLSEKAYNIKISGLFIVSAPYWGIDEDWQRADFHLQNDFVANLTEIPQIILYHSLDEKIVHIAYAKKLLQANKRELKGAQHLFENGLPELINDIKSLPSN